MSVKLHQFAGWASDARCRSGVCLQSSDRRVRLVAASNFKLIPSGCTPQSCDIGLEDGASLRPPGTWHFYVMDCLHSRFIETSDLDSQLPSLPNCLVMPFTSPRIRIKRKRMDGCGFADDPHVKSVVKYGLASRCRR